MRFINDDDRGILSSIYLSLLFSCSFTSATTQHNVTIHNTDSSITYWPPSSWGSTTATNTQFQPVDCTPRQGTTYRVAYLDTSVGKGEQATSAMIGIPRFQPTEQDDDWRIRNRGCSHSDFMPINRPITLRFNFTGTAIYLFGIILPPPTPPTPNIIFTIDGEQVRIPPNHLGTSEEDLNPCSTNEPIFWHTDLSDDLEHQLSVSIYPHSIFLLDHIVYTRVTRRFEPRVEEPLSSESKRKKQHKHNVATYAAAVGIVVGILTIVSLIIIFSINRRRRLARLRDLQEESSTESSQDPNGLHQPRIRAQRLSSTTISSSLSRLHTNASEDSPNPNLDTMMEGPAPFIPRFFPGRTTTVTASHLPEVGVNTDVVEDEIEQDPPPYDVSISSPSVPSTSSNPIHVGELATRNPEMEVYPSYADVPPPTPPLSRPLTPALPQSLPSMREMHSPNISTSNSSSPSPSPPSMRETPSLTPSSPLSHSSSSSSSSSSPLGNPDSPPLRRDSSTQPEPGSSSGKFDIPPGLA